MSEYYACEFYMKKYDEDGKSWYVHKDEEVISSIPHIWDFIDFSADIVWVLDNDERFSSLDNGIYRCFIFGEMEFESSVDWESGIEEGNFIFEFDKVKIVRLSSEHEDFDWSL